LLIAQNPAAPTDWSVPPPRFVAAGAVLHHPWHQPWHQREASDEDCAIDHLWSSLW